MVTISTNRILEDLIASGRDEQALAFHADVGAETPKVSLAIAEILEARGDDTALGRHLETATRKFPADPGLAASMVRHNLRAGAFDRAAREAETFLRRSGSAALWPMRVEALFRGGDPEGAAATLQAFMPRSPLNGRAWMVAARLLRDAPADQGRHILSHLDEALGVLPLEYGRDHGEMLFARALILEDLGDHVAAAESIRRANAVMRELATEGAAEESRQLEGIATRIDADWIASRALEGGPAPVFLVGPPPVARDAQYRRLTSGGLPLAGSGRMTSYAIARAAGPWFAPDHPERIAALTRGDLERIREGWLDILRRAGAGDAFVIPGTWHVRHVGLLAAIFPRARFLEVRRPRDEMIIEILRAPLDPRDHPWATSLRDCRDTLEAWGRMSAHWSGVPGIAWQETPGSAGEGGTAPGWPWPAPSLAAREAYSEFLIA